MRTKKTRSSAEVSSPFTALAARLSTWRNAGRPGRRIPEALWHAAVELAAAQGLSPASSRLKFNYYQLQRRLNSGRPVPKGLVVPPGFVTLPAPPLSLATAGADGGSLELVRPSGCRITLRWPGARPQELLALGARVSTLMIQITPHMKILVAVEPVDFRNHSERVIIPSASQRPMKIMADVAGFVLCDSE